MFVVHERAAICRDVYVFERGLRRCFRLITSRRCRRLARLLTMSRLILLPRQVIIYACRCHAMLLRRAYLMPLMPTLAPACYRQRCHIRHATLYDAATRAFADTLPPMPSLR